MSKQKNDSELPENIFFDEDPGTDNGGTPLDDLENNLGLDDPDNGGLQQQTNNNTPPEQRQLLDEFNQEAIDEIGMDEEEDLAPEIDSDFFSQPDADETNNANNVDDSKEDKDEDIDIDKINKITNRDFKSVDEIKKFFGEKEKAAAEPEKPVITPEEQSQYETYKKQIDFLNGAVAKKNYDLVLENKLSNFKQENGRDADEDEIDEIKSDLEEYKRVGPLDMQADNVRNKLKEHIQKRQEYVQSLDKRQSDYKQQKIKANQEKLVDNFKGIYSNKDNFYGLDLKPDDIKEAYNDVVSGNFFKQIENDPKLTAELAILIKKRSELRERTSGAGFGDGVKKVMNELADGKGNSSSGNRIVKSANGTSGKYKGKGNLISDFVV